MIKKLKDTPRIPIEDYEALAVCIRSEQVPPEDIYDLWLSDPVFYKWYRQRYFKKNERTKKQHNR